MKRIDFFIVFLILSIFIFPIISADNLSVYTTSVSDKANDSFYVSNNSIKEIYFNIDYFSENLKEGKVELSYEVFPNSSGVNIDLSSTSFIFYNPLETKENITIKTQNLTEQKTIQLKIKILDKYQNILETKTKYITIIPNNSETYYNYTKDHRKPRLLGYNLSRAILIINGETDSDIVSVFIKSEYNSSYSVSCVPSSSKIYVDYKYKGAEQTDLNITVDKELESGDYFLNCKIHDDFESMDIREIKIRYNRLEDKNVVEETVPKKITSFFNLPKFESSKTFILFAIFIILVILIIFSKSN